MIKNYSEFILEDLNRSKSILKSKLEDYDKLKTLLKKSLGYIGKFTEFLFNGVPYNELENLYNQINDLKNKNIKINIDEYNKYEDVLDSISKKIITYKFKNIFNKFPKEQKDIVGEPKELDPSHILSISKLYDIDHTAIITKISRYKNFSDLIGAIERFLDSKLKSYNREDIKSMLDDKLILSFENDKILIVKTIDHDAIKKVGDDTSWCIVRSRSTFESYTKEGRSQFVAIDYTKDHYDIDFKIGFTIDTQNTILYAHNVLDHTVISDIKKLLHDNNVKISDINIVSKADLESIDNKSSLSSIGNVISLMDINDNQTFNKILSALSFKYNRVRKGGGDILSLIRKLFKKLSNTNENSVILDEQFDSYKTILGNSYEDIKKYLIDKHILISNVAPIDIFSDIENFKTFYKYWDYKIEGSISAYFDLIKKNGIAEQILYYALKSEKTADVNLLIYYCKFMKGEKINIDEVKSIIDANTKINKIKYYNYFGIKYSYFDGLDDEYNLEIDNILPGNVTLSNKSEYKLDRLLPKLINCQLTIEYSKDEFLAKLNEGYKIQTTFSSTDDGSRVPENTRVVRKVNNRYQSFSYIVEPINGQFQSKSRKISFKETTKFPINYKVYVEIRPEYRTKGYKGEVNVIIK